MKTFNLIKAIRAAIESDDTPPSDTRLLMYKDNSTVNDFLVTLTGYDFETLTKGIKHDDLDASND
jgi:hypothetical protein